MLALTAPDFVGVATAELEFWLKWWSGGGWTPAGPEKASRDPRREQERIRAELRAREHRAGAGGGRSTRS